jgi:hypothetical protein
MEGQIKLTQYQISKLPEEEKQKLKDEKQRIKDEKNENKRKALEILKQEKLIIKEEKRKIAAQKKKEKDKIYLRKYMSEKYKKDKIEKITDLLKSIDDDTLLNMIKNDKNIIKLSEIQKMTKLLL